MSAKPNIPRYLANSTKEDLKRKMVFLGGPRQVGKTTLALGLQQVAGPGHPGNLNWSKGSTIPEAIASRSWSLDPPAWITTARAATRFRDATTTTGYRMASACCLLQSARAAVS